MAEESINTIFIILGISMFMILLYYSRTDIKDAREIQGAFSEVGLESSYFYRVLSSPCLNNQYTEENEIKLEKFIIDKNKINAIQSESNGIPEIPCLDLTYAKYQMHIKDLETKEQWNFQNYQSSDRNRCTRLIPDYDMVVQINDYSEPPVSELEVPKLDISRKGLLSVGIEIYSSEERLPEDIICEDSHVSPTILSEGSEPYTHIDDIYEYTANNCESGNCIKGPGQANATCQRATYKYNKPNGAECTYDEECSSYQCIRYKCKNAPAPKKLVNCQPCRKHSDCLSGLCNSFHYCSAT